ncbi:MAG: hypothetical protein D6799_04115 [Bacteroidetes bacterium]|nr:MAG: hypothetical protein D6799_04115 [Bacteroidota bacterium]
MAAKKKDKKSKGKEKKSVKKQVKSTKNKSKSAIASKAKTKTANKKSKIKKTSASKTSPKKKNTPSAIKKKKSVAKTSSSSSAKKDKTLKKAVKKTLTTSKKNLKNQASNNNKKSTAKKKAKVKLTKADAARTTTLNTSASSSSEQSQLSEQQSITKKTTTSSKTDNLPKESITIEKVMEETEDKSFLPKSLQSSEKTAFSESLSEDFSSVYARTSEEMPEPPGKYVMEFICKVSPELLYKFLTDPVELAEWFCDSVNVRNGIYTFVWNGMPQQARLVKQERNVSVRYQWLDKNDGSYFEFNIFKNYLTGDVVLYVTDFSPPEELESNKLWWTNQINKLKTILGLQY